MIEYSLSVDEKEKGMCGNRGEAGGAALAGAGKSGTAPGLPAATRRYRRGSKMVDQVINRVVISLCLQQ
jgi:hypothetical protein